MCNSFQGIPKRRHLDSDTEKIGVDWDFIQVLTVVPRVCKPTLNETPTRPPNPASHFGVNWIFWNPGIEVWSYSLSRYMPKQLKVFLRNGFGVDPCLSDMFIWWKRRGNNYCSRVAEKFESAWSLTLPVPNHSHFALDSWTVPPSTGATPFAMKPDELELVLRRLICVGCPRVTWINSRGLDELPEIKKQA